MLTTCLVSSSSNFRITPKIESLVVLASPDVPSKFQKDPSRTFWVILLTHRQTDTNKNQQKHNLLGRGNYSIIIITLSHAPSDFYTLAELDAVWVCILFRLTAKEIHLKHQAPVISICVIDRNAVPLPAPFEVEHECARPPDMTSGHCVIISSEEQLKVGDNHWLHYMTD